jgi:hypothetical protein
MQRLRQGSRPPSGWRSGQPPCQRPQVPQAVSHILAGPTGARWLAGGTLRWYHSVSRQANFCRFYRGFRSSAPSLRARHRYLTHRQIQKNLIINLETCRWYNSVG